MTISTRFYGSMKTLLKTYEKPWTSHVFEEPKVIPTWKRFLDRTDACFRDVFIIENMKVLFESVKLSRGWMNRHNHLKFKGSHFEYKKWIMGTSDVDLYGRIAQIIVIRCPYGKMNGVQNMQMVDLKRLVDTYASRPDGKIHSIFPTEQLSLEKSIRFVPGSAFSKSR